MSLSDNHLIIEYSGNGGIAIIWVLFADVYYLGCTNKSQKINLVHDCCVPKHDKLYSNFFPIIFFDLLQYGKQIPK